MSVASKKSRRLERRDAYYRQRQERAVAQARREVRDEVERIHALTDFEDGGVLPDGGRIAVLNLFDPPSQPRHAVLLPNLRSFDFRDPLDVAVLDQARFWAEPMQHAVRVPGGVVKVRWWNWRPA